MREIEQRGLYFDEFEEDVKYLHRPGRTVTEADNVFFTTLTMNTQALHLDAAWSEQQEFGQRLVNSMFTLSTVVGMSVAQLTQGTIVANLGFSEVAFPHPVHHGDTLYAETTVDRQAAVGVAARPGDRDVLAPRSQPARRDRGAGDPHDAGVDPGGARQADGRPGAETGPRGGVVTLHPRPRAAVLPRRPARPVREGARPRRRRDPRPRGCGRAREPRGRARGDRGAELDPARVIVRVNEVGSPDWEADLARRRALPRRSWCRRPTAACSTRCPHGFDVDRAVRVRRRRGRRAGAGDHGSRAHVGRRGPRRLARRHLEPARRRQLPGCRAHRPRERPARGGRGRHPRDRHRAPRHRRPRRIARRGRGRRRVRVRGDRVHPPLARRGDPRGLPADRRAGRVGDGGFWMPRPANEGVFRFEGGMVDGPVLRHAEAVVRTRGAATPTPGHHRHPERALELLGLELDRDGAEVGERRDVRAAAGDARRAAGQVGDPVPPIGEQVAVALDADLAAGRDPGCEGRVDGRGERRRVIQRRRVEPCLPQRLADPVGVRAHRARGSSRSRSRRHRNRGSRASRAAAPWSRRPRAPH